MRGRKKRAGYTLMEVTLATALTGSLMLSFTVSAIVLTDQAGATNGKEGQFNGAHLILSEIEQTIRLADEVLRAGDGFLELSTRFALNDTDDEEKIIYLLDDGNLYTKVAPEGSGYGAPVKILTGVTEFNAFTLDIADEFMSEQVDNFFFDRRGDHYPYDGS